MNANLALTSRSCRLSKAPRPRYGPGAPSERAPAASVGAAAAASSTGPVRIRRIRARRQVQVARRAKGGATGRPSVAAARACRDSESEPARFAGGLAARRPGINPRHWHAQAGPGTAAAVTGLSRQPAADCAGLGGSEPTRRRGLPAPRYHPDFIFCFRFSVSASTSVDTSTSKSDETDGLEFVTQGRRSPDGAGGAVSATHSSI